jgi:hypothetical protein
VVYGYFDSWVLHIDTLGNIINQRVFGNSADNRLDAVIALPDNKVAAIGTYRGGPFLEGPYSEGLSNQTLVAGGNRDMFIAILGSETMTVPEVNNSSTVAWDIYPNPAQQALHINVKDDGRYTLKIYDVLGRLVLEEVFLEKQHVITISSLHNGLYNFQLFKENTNMGIRKLSILKP